jgi:hypothetical protein
MFERTSVFLCTTGHTSVFLAVKAAAPFSKKIFLPAVEKVRVDKMFLTNFAYRLLLEQVKTKDCHFLFGCVQSTFPLGHFQ